jgi:tripartite-type tricarboxylate transporter receptor subunit TctC
MVTRTDFPANSVAELIALAKQKPGKVVFGSPGFGATQHLAAELFKQTAGVDMLHVPFRTSPETTTALLAGNVDVVFETVSAVLGQVQAGKLKALAVTGRDRFPAVPDVPAAIESGRLPGYDVTTWYGVFAPHGTPPAVIAKLNKTLNEIVGEPGVRDRLTKAGVVVKGSTPEEFGQMMERELDRWEIVRQKAGLEKR